MAAYFVLQYLGFQYFKEQRDVRGLLLYAIGLTVVLAAIIVAKGERPAGWRWGRK